MRCTDKYLNLIKLFPLISIKDDEHLELASKIVDKLSARKRTKWEDLYLNALCDLIWCYESDIM
jgi:hypothetical protein